MKCILYQMPLQLIRLLIDLHAFFSRISQRDEEEENKENKGDKGGDGENEDQTERGPLGARLRNGLRFGLVELVDHTLPWVLLGLIVAAFAAYVGFVLTGRTLDEGGRPLRQESAEKSRGVLHSVEGRNPDRHGEIPNRLAGPQGLEQSLRSHGRPGN